MSDKSAFSPSDSLKGEPEKATNDNNMNEDVLEIQAQNSPSGGFGVKAIGKAGVQPEEIPTARGSKYCNMNN